MTGFLKDVGFLGNSLLTQDLIHRSFEIEHAGSLVVSRDLVGSTVEHVELFQEAGIWTITRELSGCGMFRTLWSGRTRRLDETL